MDDRERAEALLRYYIDSDEASIDHVEAVFKQVRAEERERCAKRIKKFVLTPQSSNIRLADCQISIIGALKGDENDPI